MAAPAVQAQPMRSLTLESGLLDVQGTTAPSGTSELASSAMASTPSTSTTTIPVQTLGALHDSGSHTLQTNLDIRQQAELLAQRRVADSVAKSKPVSAPRKRRTCRKCAKPECPGSQKVSNCKNPCRDCRTVSCRGRNSKRPEKTCYEGWDC